MTKIEAIQELLKYDHAFLTKEAVKEFTQPFGFIGSTYLAHANPNDFKGLSLFDDNGKPIDKAIGQDAAKVACEIADHLGIKYLKMYGRGSQLRSACEAILKYLNTCG